MMKSRVTLRDVAREAGVHISTASLALRNSEKLNNETRLRVRQIAERLGYRPDPMLAALSAYRAAHRPAGFKGTLAWISNYHTADYWRRIYQYREYYEGAQQRAAELGFALECFWWRAPGITPARLCGILEARNIRGLLLCPQEQQNARLEFAWENFSALTFGYTLGSPKLHVVTNHQFNSVVKICQELRALGYRRIGLAVDGWIDARVNGHWSAGFWSMQRQWPAADHVPFFLPERGGYTEETFCAWFRQHEPDAIILPRPLPPDWLDRIGRTVPATLGVASLTVHDAGQAESGMDETSSLIGRSAVDFLVGMIQRQEYGVPENVQALLIQGRWCPGTQVRRQSVAADEKIASNAPETPPLAVIPSRPAAQKRTRLPR